MLQEVNSKLNVLLSRIPLACPPFHDATPPTPVLPLVEQAMLYPDHPGQGYASSIVPPPPSGPFYPAAAAAAGVQHPSSASISASAHGTQLPNVTHQQRKEAKTRTLSLGNGTTIVFTEEDVPAPPTTTFTDNIPRLNSMWDDTSVHWDRDSVLKIFGHPIALIYWPEVYTRWKAGDWDTLKSQYVNWKVRGSTRLCSFLQVSHPSCIYVMQAVIEQYREGTKEDFWAEFRDSKGRCLSFTAIAARLTAERVAENGRLAKRARIEYGDSFNSVFSYRKGSSRIVMKDPTSIANKYREFHK
jgi:hypothetical protein